MKTNLRPFLLGISLAILLLRTNVPAASVQVVVNGTVPVGSSIDYINQFELYNGGIYWSEGSGGCTPEFRSDSRIGILGVIGGAPQRIVNDCTFHLDAVTRTETHAFYAHDGRLWRKPVGAISGAAEYEVPASPFTPVTGNQQMGAMTTWGSRVYWSTASGNRFDVLSVSADGTDVRHEFQGTGGLIRRLKVANYRGSNGGFVVPVPALFILTETGALLRFDLDPRASSPVLLANGVLDFDIRQELLGGGPFVVPSTGLYAAVGLRSQIQSSTPAGKVVRINPANGSQRLIYTAPGQNQITSLAVDEHALFIVEQPVVGCADLFGCMLVGSNLKRQLNPAQNGTPENPFQLINTTDGAWFNLRSDDQWLYYIAGKQVHRIKTDAPPLELDVQADFLEVVQAVQNLNNQVRLIANKPTFARGYAHLTVNTTAKSLWFPEARLHGYFNGSELPGSPLPPVNSSAVSEEKDLALKRPKLEKSFLFELPRHWIQAGNLQLSMTVDESHSIPETVPSPYNNNTVFTPVLSVAASGSPCLVVVPLWTEAGEYDPLSPNSGFPEILARAKSLLPVEDIRVFLRAGRIEKPVVKGEFHPECLIPFSFCLPFQVKIYNRPFQFPEDKNWGLFWTAVANALNRDPNGCPDTHWLGTLPQEGQGSFNGVGGARGVKVGDLVDVGLISDISIPATPLDNTVVVRMNRGGGNSPLPWNQIGGGHTLAHELGHNYGRFHIDQTLSPTNCGTQKPDRPWQLSPPYPFDACTLGPIDYASPSSYFGFDPISRTVIPPDMAGDTMSYASSRWSSAIFWDAVYSPISSPPPAPPLSIVLQGTNDRYLLLGGQMDFRSNRVETLPAYVLPESLFDPVFLNASLAALGQIPPRWSYRVKLLSSGGSVLSDQPLRLLPGVDEASSVVPFLQLMPFVNGAERVQVWGEGFLLGEQTASSHQPALQLGTPTFSLQANSSRVNLSWIASDADGDPLMFTVLWSHDRGSTWQVIDPAHTSQEISINAELLPGTQAQLRVIATDGLNTTIADTEPFLIAAHGPKIVISGVQDGARIPYGHATHAFGMAYDANQGSYDGSRLHWSLSGPQPLPSPQTGDTLSLFGLSSGHYTLSLSTVGSNNRSTTNSINFDVDPMLVTDGLGPELDGYANDPGYEAAPWFRMALGGSAQVPVRLVHADGFLYVSAQGIPFGANGKARFELRFDPAADRSSAAQADDVGFGVDENGIPNQESAVNGTMTITDNPRPGFTAVVARGASTWSAELRIADNLIGGWNHPAGLMAGVILDQLTFVWPASASKHGPSTWCPVVLGTAPTPSNRAPVAVAGAFQELVPAVPMPVILDGSGSYDPEGSPLTYLWSQVSGPSVFLENGKTAQARFTAPPVTTLTRLRFRLVVRDANLNSVPSEVVVQLLPGTLPSNGSTGPQQSLKPDGTFAGELRVPLDGTARFRVLASSNFVNWVPLATNTVNFYQSLAFLDPDGLSRPHRFYRAEPIPHSVTVIYRHDFERPVGAEWNLKPVEATPKGSRHFLGQFGTGGPRLNLNSLPAHQRVRLEFDLYLIRSWDGNDGFYGPDRFKVSVVGGPTLLDTTFACSLSQATQNYPYPTVPGSPPLTGAVERATLGYPFANDPSLDAVYHFSIPFNHSATALQIDFAGLGLQELADESWGLDNVEIVVENGL